MGRIKQVTEGLFKGQYVYIDHWFMGWQCRSRSGTYTFSYNGIGFDHCVGSLDQIYRLASDKAIRKWEKKQAKKNALSPVEAKKSLIKLPVWFDEVNMVIKDSNHEWIATVQVDSNPMVIGDMETEKLAAKARELVQLINKK